MKNEVTVYKEDYFIKRYDEEEVVKITKEQHEGLEKVLLDTNAKFVKIGDKIIATASIKEVFKEPKKPQVNIYEESGSNPYFREWCFSSENYIPFDEWVNKNKGTL